MSVAVPALSIPYIAGHQVASGISPGNLAEALLVYLTGQIGWPDFGRMCGVDGTAQADGEPLGS